MSTEYQVVIPDSGIASEIIDRIGQSQYLELKRHSDVIDRFFEEYLGYWILEGNIDSFERYLKYDHSKILLKQSLSETEKERVRIQLNRKFLNILSSFRSFIDHAETAVSRQAAVDEGIIQRFKAAQSAEYDSNAFYRFAWELRNYSQHCSLPIDNYGVELERSKNGLVFKTNLKPILNAAYLLGTWTKWKSNVRSWLEIQKSIVVTELLNEVRKSVLKIQRSFTSRNEREIRESYEFLCNFTATPKLTNRTVVLYEINSGHPSSSIHISLYKLAVAFTFVTGRTPPNIQYDDGDLK